MPDEAMKRMCDRNLIRYAVRKTIFCPRCESVLDVRRAVLLPGMLTVCEGCYLLAGSPSSAQDGRVLFSGKTERAVDPKIGCHLHDVPKFGCGHCKGKRDRLQRVADKKREQLEGESE